jgi:hypothetical protein
VDFCSHNHKVKFCCHDYKVDFCAHNHKVDFWGHDLKMNLCGHNQKVDFCGHGRRGNFCAHCHNGNCWGHNRKVVEFTSTLAISLYSYIPVHTIVYLIQFYVIKFVSDLWQVSGFIWLSELSLCRSPFILLWGNLIHNLPYM